VATFEVSTLSRGTFDGSSGAENFFLSGSPTWTLFAFTATINDIFQGVDPLGVAVSEIVEGFSAAGVIIEDNGDLPANAVVTRVAMSFPGIVGNVIKSHEEGDYVRLVTAIKPEKGAPATEFLVHAGTDFPEGLISETQPVIVIPTNTRGEEWSRGNLFAEMFGVYSFVSSGLSGNDVALGEMQVRVTFDMVAPTVNTALGGSTPATNLEFRASVDPNGATTTYPVLVSFKYGTALEDEADWVRTGTTSVTGTGTRIVGIAGEGLLPNTTYYYRAYAAYADGEVVASKTAEFTTSALNEILQVF
jgi:hypothetical protein